MTASTAVMPSKEKVRHLCALYRVHPWVWSHAKSGASNFIGDPSVTPHSFAATMKAMPDALRKLMRGEDVAMTTAEAAEALGVSKPTVPVYLRPIIAVNRTRRWSRAEVMALKAEWNDTVTP